MKVMLACYEGFSCCSMTYIVNFANELVRQGHSVAVAVPRVHPEELDNYGKVLFRPLSFDQALAGLGFDDDRPAEILHAWTPRESVRIFASTYTERYGTPLIIHLEDDEDHIREKYLGPRAKDAGNGMSMPVPGNISHGTRHRIFMGLAAGFTLVWPSLEHFLPPGIPFLHLPLSVDPDRFVGATPIEKLEARFGIRPEEKIILYAGGLNECLREDQESLYQAVLQLNQSGFSCRLVRTGPATIGTAELLAQGSSPYVLELGFLPFVDLVGLMRRANLFVQPGNNNDFNRYRMPGKIPEFMQAGTPLVIPKCNLGDVLRDGEEAILLKDGSAGEIALACKRILSNPGFAKRLGQGGRKAGKRLFSLVDNTRRLASFYSKVISENKNTPELPPVAFTFREFAFLQAALEKALEKKDLQEIQRVAAQLRMEVANQGAGGDAVVAQLYWALDDEPFGEKESEIIRYARDVPLRIRFHPRLAPHAGLRSIRFRLDPANEPGRLIVYEIRVLDAISGKELANWCPPTLELVAGGDLASQDEAAGLFISFGNDPYLIFSQVPWENGKPLLLEVGLHWQSRPAAMAEAWSRIGNAVALGSLKNDLITLKNDQEEKIGKLAEELKGNKNMLGELGNYMGQIQDLASSPWINYLPAPLSWPTLLFKTRSIKRPPWFPRAQPNPPRKKPGFWRRLERSIRKRRKRWTEAWGFNAKWYLENYPDVKEARIDPLEHYLLYGIAEGRKKHPQHQPRPTEIIKTNALYLEWIQKFDTLNDQGRLELQKLVTQKGASPKVSVLLPTFNSQIPWLEQAIQSVLCQVYPNWELIICDDGSDSRAVLEFLQTVPHGDPRIRVIFRKARGHIAESCNSALDAATGSWVVVLDHDDLLHETALFYVAETIIRYPNSVLIYSDEDKIKVDGERFDPYFKSDFDRVLMWGHNMVTHLAAMKKSSVLEVGGFRKGFEGSQDYDLFLRLSEKFPHEAIRHVPRVLYHWRAHPQSTAMGPVAADGSTAKPYALAASEQVVNQHLERIGLTLRVEADPKILMHRLIPSQSHPRPKVSILIPTRNQGGLLQTCVQSIFAKTNYPDSSRRSREPHFEVLILDNGSDLQEDLTILEDLEIQYPTLRIHPVPGPFNYSRINNAGVRAATGDLVCLLNNDTEIIEGDWLAQLAMLAVLPWVGAVGAKLLYPDRTIQHAGVVTGIGGSAAHVLKGSPEDSLGYFCRATLPSRFSAVTGACLMVKKSDYQDVGGLDEEDFRVAFNDVDFCLKLEARGKVNVLNPAAVLIHHESKSRGYEDNPQKIARFNLEKENLLAKWGRRIFEDPWYNPNLTLEKIDYSLAWSPRT